MPLKRDHAFITLKFSMRIFSSHIGALTHNVCEMFYKFKKKCTIKICHLSSLIILINTIEMDQSHTYKCHEYYFILSFSFQIQDFTIKILGDLHRTIQFISENK